MYWLSRLLSCDSRQRVLSQFTRKTRGLGPGLPELFLLQLCHYLPLSEALTRVLLSLISSFTSQEGSPSNLTVKLGSQITMLSGCSPQSHESPWEASEGNPTLQTGMLRCRSNRWCLHIPVKFPAWHYWSLAQTAPGSPQAGVTGPGPKALQSADGPPLPGPGLNGMNSSIWEHFASGSFSPGTSPAFLSGPGAAELARLRQELDEANGTIKQWVESWKQAKQVLSSQAHPPSPGPRAFSWSLSYTEWVQGLGQPGALECRAATWLFILCPVEKLALSVGTLGSLVSQAWYPLSKLFIWSGSIVLRASPQKP